MLYYYYTSEALFSPAIGGAGGCGKSRVIEAIPDYMHFQGRLHTVRMLSPSSAAAVGINGLTIQSMLHDRRNKSSSGNSPLTQTHMSVVENEWHHIDYCFIDEISMVGCYMLAQFHKITTIAKHTLPTVPFGGINVIFLGDFVQYAPVLDRPLYSNLLLPSDTLSHLAYPLCQNKKRSKYILNRVCLLHKKDCYKTKQPSRSLVVNYHSFLPMR